MTILFWAIGGALAALALWAILRPLDARRAGAAVSRRAANLAIYRDQRRELEADLAAGKIERADYERALAELEARALEDADAPDEAAARRGRRRLEAIALGAGTPLVALAIYFAVGSPGALTPQPHGAGEVTAAQIEAMVEGLAARLRENPDDAEGWKMLGRSYAALGRFDAAVDAYAKAALRAPRDAQLLTDFADALAMARGRSLQGEPENLVRRALEIDPRNLKALALAGTAEFDRGDFAAAAATWERMLTHVPPESEDARAIRENVAEARRRAGGATPPTLAAAPAAGLRGTVRLSPGLRDQVAPGDTVFIYARAEKGPAMPLAILRRSAQELPIAYALDDSMAMAPGMGLSSQPRVVITARISRSGNARPQPGDLQGASAPVANDATGVDVLIDSVVK
ncbi:MAG: c-type cytochrome biogenesis protein CcmI [Betaproteobacteria bacterium]|nr:c-type cytochrome biogenesis protein CcmI [Betaproteobacteria bacterium]MDH5221636.1 c-type cytochrome biogenesis protein CcmI [Betaproteobacteria bacterium]MDH5349718.1 c-type cytochrome biogenesis protein CcmI [Betaproteobacteria bacterium]